MTNYAAEYGTKGILDELNFIAPPCPISSLRFEYKRFGRGDFFIDDINLDIRNLHGDFRQLTQSGDNICAKAENKGLELIIDESEYNKGCEEAAVRKIMRILIRNELIRAYLLAIKMAGEPSLKEWSKDSSKPDSDPRELAQSLTNVCGASANRIILSSDAWSSRLGYYENSISGIMSVKQLSEKILVDKMKVSNEFHKKTEDDKIIKTPILPSGMVLAFWGEDEVSLSDFSSIKRFCTDFKVYKEAFSHYIKITVEHYSLLATTGAGSIKALKVS